MPTITGQFTDEDRQECDDAIAQMRSLSALFYSGAVMIGNHPFIEFTGLMNEYINCCHRALREGVDFRNCNAHSGHHLPMQSFQVAYVNEKLECIFTGRSVVER